MCTKKQSVWYLFLKTVWRSTRAEEMTRRPAENVIFAFGNDVVQPQGGGKKNFRMKQSVVLTLGVGLAQPRYGGDGAPRCSESELSPWRRVGAVPGQMMLTHHGAESVVFAFGGVLAQSQGCGDTPPHCRGSDLCFWRWSAAAPRWGRRHKKHHKKQSMWLETIWRSARAEEIKHHASMWS
jgi:hypothetical protein